MSGSIFEQEPDERDYGQSQQNPSKEKIMGFRHRPAKITIGQPIRIPSSSRKKKIRPEENLIYQFAGVTLKSPLSY